MSKLCDSGECKVGEFQNFTLGFLGLCFTRFTTLEGGVRLPIHVPPSPLAGGGREGARNAGAEGPVEPQT